MKKSNTPIAKSAPKAKTKQASVDAETKSKRIHPIQKALKKSQAMNLEPVTPTPELPVLDRVGLTAGSIWQYLAEQGATSVAKLLKELPEEEKIIQRSIGWLAQEGKIKLDMLDRVETISLLN